MSISKSELRLLHAIQLDATRSVPELARHTRLQKSSVQYYLSKLRDREAFSPFALINPHTLGLTDYCLFISPVGHSEALVEKALAVFHSDPSVAYVVELVGGFLFSVSCFGSDIRVVDQLFKKLKEELPRISWQKHFAIRVEWTVLSVGYLAKDDPKRSLVRSVHVERAAIDERDAALLSAISLSPEAPLSKNARAAGLPEATARMRFQKLMEENVLLGFPSIIRPKLVGRSSYRIIISVTGRDDVLDNKFRCFGSDHPLISDFVVCVGDWDYEYNLQVVDPGEVRDCISKLRAIFGKHIVQVRTMTDIAIHKLHQFDVKNALFS